LERTSKKAIITQLRYYPGICLQGLKKTISVTILWWFMYTVRQAKCCNFSRTNIYSPPSPEV
jgi:hypothetical protein